MDQRFQSDIFGTYLPSIPARVSWMLATGRPLSRGIRKWFRKRLARNFPGPFDVVAEDIRLRAWPTENRCDRVAVGREELPERLERELIRPLLKPGMTFVDIGANVGVYSLFISHQTGGRADIFAFEPHPRTYLKLKTNCMLNDFIQVRMFNFGIGARQTDAELFSDGGGNIGGSSLLAEAAGATTSVTVSVRPLFDVLQEKNVTHIDLLKIDIEGFEDRALVPLLRSTTGKNLWPKAILLETVHQQLWQEDLLSILGEAGYQTIGRTDENLLLQR